MLATAMQIMQIDTAASSLKDKRCIDYARRVIRVGYWVVNESGKGCA